MTKCILCKSEDWGKRFSITDLYQEQYSFCKCKDCGAYFLDPPPTAQQLERAYANDYYGEGEKKFNPTVEKVLDQFRSRKAKEISSGLKEGSKILDIGCADGEFLHQLSKFGDFDLHGLELEGRASERARKRGGFQLHIGELKEGVYEKGQFDLITLVHVFEHLPDPAGTVAILSGIIKKGGELYIEQPNIGSWQARIFRSNWLHLDPPRHLNLLDEKTLIKLLEEHQFILTSKSYFSPQFSPFGVQQSLLNLICRKREVLYEHLKGNQEYTKEYSKLNLFVQKLFHWLSFPLFIMTDLIASIFHKGGTIKLVFRKTED